MYVSILRQIQCQQPVTHYNIASRNSILLQEKFAYSVIPYSTFYNSPQEHTVNLQHKKLLAPKVTIS